ncbi:serine-rich adhesin for platelets-like isoform X1 [Liolophura sinensis]|uniref:serine-rich adhesin for platelets-like isoform X1 n=3 Tax=Liolophura sinensis TaxID=3198878 RepID=UPI003157FA88
MDNARLYKVTDLTTRPAKVTPDQLEVTESGNAVKVHSDVPHLVSLGSGRLSTAVTLHPLPEGCTTIGTNQSSSPQDIVVQGTGVQANHCSIENRHGVITLHPLAKPCAVDGLLIEKPTRLAQGSMICIGRSNYFRFNHPQEARKIKDAMPNCRISVAPLTFLQGLEDNPEYLKMISEASGTKANGSTLTDSPLVSQSQPRPTPRSAIPPPVPVRDSSRSKVHKINKEIFRDSLEKDDFVNKVCKFELISRGKSSPRSPTNSGSPSPSVGSDHHERSGDSSDSSAISSPNVTYAGEKLFTKDTATTRVAFSVVQGAPPVTPTDRIPSTCSSTSTTSLTSVSSLASSSSSDTCSSHSSLSSGNITMTSPASPLSTSPFYQQPPGVYKDNTKHVPVMGNSLVFVNGAVVNGGNRGSGSSLGSDFNNPRHTFEGIDFDITELTASQQDLSMKHKEIVAERKREQELEKQERQRLEEILMMCAEYEKQVESENKTKDQAKQPIPVGRHFNLNLAQNMTTDPNLSGSTERKDKSEFRNSITKIKTNGSLNLLASPNNPQKEGTVFGFQPKRCGSSSSNSEDEPFLSSEETGTIKKRPPPPFDTTKTDNKNSHNFSPVSSPSFRVEAVSKVSPPPPLSSGSSAASFPKFSSPANQPSSKDSNNVVSSPLISQVTAADVHVDYPKISHVPKPNPPPPIIQTESPDDENMVLNFKMEDSPKGSSNVDSSYQLSYEFENKRHSDSQPIIVREIKELDSAFDAMVHEQDQLQMMINASANTDSTESKAENTSGQVHCESSVTNADSETESARCPPEIKVEVTVTCNGEDQVDFKVSPPLMSSPKTDTPRSSTEEPKSPVSSVALDVRSPVTSDSDQSLHQMKGPERAASSSGVETSSENSLHSIADTELKGHAHLSRLKKMKAELLSRINELKKQIQEIEAQENEAIRELEMERALLEGEHKKEMEEMQKDQEHIDVLQEKQQRLIQRAAVEREKVNI